MVVCVVASEIGIVCERVRSPHLCGRPVALVTEDCVVAVSEEARRMAVRTGQSAKGAKHLCPDLAALPYDAPLYREAARAIWDALAVESSIVEPVTAERCFAWMDGTLAEITERMEALAERIAERTDLRIRVGLARTKVLAAKAASETAPCSVLTVAADFEREFLAGMGLGQVEAIPPEVRERLARLGVHTIGDLQRVPAAELERQFRAFAMKLVRLAEGEDDDPVRAAWPPRAFEETFRFETVDGGAEDAIDRRYLEHGLRCCAERIAERLEVEHTRCRSLKLAVCCHDGSTHCAEEALERGVSCRKVLFATGLRLLGRMRVETPPEELVLSASEIGVGSAVQMGLLDERGIDYERERKLKNTTAALRRHYGIGAVSEGVAAAPRQSMLFTCPLTHLRSEPVDVELDGQEQPAVVARLGNRGGVWDMRVTVRDQWVETYWGSGERRECATYRVETEEGGVFDLVHVGFDEWRLEGIAD